MSSKVILILFVVITAAGVAIKYIDQNSFLWDFYGALDTASAVALALLAFFGYVEYMKSEDKIGIYFDLDGREIDTGLSLLRRNCTRSEVFGVLGMIQKDPAKRYKLEATKDISLLDKLQQIQKGDLDRFVIPVNEEELQQFEVGVS